MEHTITALYDDFDTAYRVVDALITAGFDRDQISVIANDVDRVYTERYDVNERYDDTDDVSGGEGAALGAVSGAIIGLGAMLIPGVGPVLAAGPLLSAIIGGGVGAVAGAVTGGITASLIDFGVDEDTAHRYAEGVRRGGALVVIHTANDHRDRAMDVMNNYSPIDVDSWAETWQATGWSRFDEEGSPYTSADIESHRSEARTLQPYVNDEDINSSAREGGTTATGSTRGTSSAYGRVRSYPSGTAYTGGTTGNYDQYDQNFRRHYQTTYANSGRDYMSYYQPAYYYGYTLARDPRYSNTESWNLVEADARLRWERDHRDTAWEDVKEAVRHAWEDVKRHLS